MRHDEAGTPVRMRLSWTPSGTWQRLKDRSTLQNGFRPGSRHESCPPNLGVQMAGNVAAKLRWRQRAFARCCQKQNGPTHMLRRSIRLVAQPFQDRRSASEAGRECPRALEMIARSSGKPGTGVTDRLDGVETPAGRPERLVDRRTRAAEDIEQSADDRHGLAAPAPFPGDAGVGRQTCRRWRSDAHARKAAKEKASASARRAMLSAGERQVA